MQNRQAYSNKIKNTIRLICQISKNKLDDLLIGCFGFYTVFAIFQPLNGKLDWEMGIFEIRSNIESKVNMILSMLIQF